MEIRNGRRRKERGEGNFLGRFGRSGVCVAPFRTLGGLYSQSEMAGHRRTRHTAYDGEYHRLRSMSVQQEG